jgi:hypothetical protein
MTRPRLSMSIGFVFVVLFSWLMTASAGASGDHLKPTSSGHRLDHPARTGSNGSVATFREGRTWLAMPKPGHVIESIYSEHVRCTGLPGCRHLIAHIWTMRVHSVYVIRGTETVARTGKLIYRFRLAHDYQDPSHTRGNFALVWQGPRLRSNRGGLMVSFIHGDQDPGIARDTIWSARRDGYIDLGNGSGYRVLGTRVFDGVKSYDLRWSYRGDYEDSFYATKNYAFLGMRSGHWSAVLRAQHSFAMCKIDRHLFAYFWKRNPGLNHCR